MTVDTYRRDGAGRLAGPAARLWRVATSGTVPSIADQCVVSGLAFAILMLIGMFAGLAQLGAFSLAMSLVALSLATQDALITRPYTVQMHDPIGCGRSHLLASFNLSLGFAGTTLLLCLVAAAALVFAGFKAEAIVALALALAIPGILLREFGRRVSFAHERSIEAVLIDVPVAAVTLAAALLLGLFGQLSAATALIVLGAANLASAIGWIVSKKLIPAFPAPATTDVAAGSWLMGRWLFLCQLAMQTQGYTTHWLTLVFLGTSATGIYAACLSVVALANPVLYGLFNIMSPSSARAYRTAGGDGAIAAARRDAMLLSALMLVFAVFVALCGGWLIDRLYPAVGDARHLLVVLSVTVLIATAGVPAAMALTSANRTSKLALVASVAVVVNLVLVIAVLPWGGLLGAAYAMVLGEAIGTAGRWIALYREIGSTRTSASNGDANA